MTHRLRAPAEDAPHARTWMCWPATQAIYGPDTAYFEDVQETIGRLAAAIAENEPVTMVAARDQHARAARLCGPNVTLADSPTNDMWARDTGPVFLRGASGEKAAVDYNFNGWGGKKPHDLDSGVAAAIARHAGCPRIASRLVGEGGGLEYDGEGTLLVADSCWVNDNRNPGMSRDEIETELKSDIGVDKVIWLPGVRGQDDTDGHIDGVIRIVRPGLVLMSGVTGDTSDWGESYRASKAILERATDAHGRPFAIVELPFAEDWRSTAPDFFSGYANYYVGNGALYSPQFGDAPADARAKATFETLFPDRKIVMPNVDRIYENGGGIHCVTQQEPA